VHTIDELEALKPDMVIPMNCTGANFIASMLRRMPERIVASNSWQPVYVRQIIQRPVL
jgi:metal-dependent hydrolase (beta-lactamase superfamily II)